jgi:hypothetical protein
MHRFVKLLPLLALFAFGAVLASWPTSATATPTAPPTWYGPDSSGLYTLTGVYTDDTPSGAGSATLQASGGNFVTGSAVLSPLDGETVTVSGASITVTEDVDTVAETKTITASFQCTTIGTVTFTLSHGGTTSTTSAVMTCNPYNGGYPGYPQYPGYPGGPGYPGYPQQQPIFNPGTISALGVTASPASVTCGQAASVAVSIKDTSGNNVPDGTPVTLSTTQGTITPNTSTTSGGSAAGTFTSAASSGTAVITATAGGTSGQATVSVTCGSNVTSPSAPPSSPPPVFVPGPGTSILPPNTGDAGLLDRNASTSTRVATAVAAALSVLIGGALVAGWTIRRERNQAS